MSRPAELRCRCGEVRGSVTNPSPRAVNRVICYCDDCQAFAHHLGRADLLDAHGGTDIVQVAPASLTFSHGQRRIAGLRLTPDGMREGAQRRDDVFGRPIGAIMGKYAVGDAPPGSTGIDLRLLIRAFLMVLGWRLRGRTWPHPYFERSTRAPMYPLTVLSVAQRDALRPLCGPSPSEHAK